MENTLKALAGVTNPNTGKTLTEESRWVNAEADQNGQVIVTYKRDGITPAQKRQVENANVGLVHNMSAAATSSTILVLEN